MMKKVCSLLLGLLLVFSLAIPAFANTLTVNGADANGSGNKTYYEIKFDVTPGSKYDKTDLFGDSFKNVMPGDTLTTQIKITANFSLFKEDSIEVFLKGGPSDPLHANIGYPDATADDSETFLNQLNLTVTNAKTGVKYFDGPAGQTFAGFKSIGKFRSNGSIVLNVTLTVPEDLGNQFSNQFGEIDWTLRISAYDDPIIDNYKTGDYIMMAVAVMAVSAAALAVLFVIRKKQRK